MSTAIAKAEKTALAPTALVRRTEAIMEAIRENLGGDTLSPSDLQVIKVPAGGGTSWEVETLDGVQSVKRLQGVVIGIRDVRAYWPTSIEQGVTGPPECYSLDGRTGIGSPGGTCAMCPFAQFGSSGKGNSQACRASKQMFTLMGDGLIPSIIRIPAGSLKAVRQFLLQMANQERAYYQVLMNFDLEPDKNAQGIKYSKIKLSIERRLTDEEMAAAAKYKADFAPLIASAPLMESHSDDMAEAA